MKDETISIICISAGISLIVGSIIIINDSIISDILRYLSIVFILIAIYFNPNP